MKVLLISPCLSVTERYGKSLGKVGPVTEPLGLAYLAAVLLKRGDYVEILDAEALRYTHEDLVKHLEKFEWDVVGVQMLTPMYYSALQVIKTTRKVRKNTKIFYL